MTTSLKAITVSSFFIGFGIFLFSPAAHADLKQIKIYKEAFPGSKPKCIDCHTSDKPKKEDGQHDPNDYGKAAKEKAAEITAETYQAVGPIEKFGK